METLFGRFPHLVEDIFGLLDGKTLFCCSQINNPWKENLKEYRFHLVKKIQKLLKNQSIVYGPVKNSLNRAVRRSENPEVPVLFGGHNLPPLVEIRLTDLPKSGRDRPGRN